MVANIRPKEELRQLSETAKDLPGKARFGLLMYAKGLRDRHGLAAEMVKELRSDPPQAAKNSN